MRTCEAAVRRAKREAEDAAFDKKALDLWFEVSGTTMADLEAAIDNDYESSDNPARCET